MAILKRIVDAHMHFWQIDLGWTPHLEAKPDAVRIDDGHGTGDYSKLIGHDYLPAEYLVDAASWPVEKMVHVTAAQTPPRWSDETSWLQRLHDTTGHPVGIVARINLDQGIDAIKAEVGKHRQSAGFRGYRNQEGVDYGSDHTRDVFGLFSELGVIYDLVAHEDQHAAAAAATRQWPEMQFVLEHSGWPSAPDKSTFKLWQAGIRDLASSPNVAVKLSGLGMVMHQGTTADFRPWVLELVDAFGPSRCMFATNFPVDGIYSTYSRLTEAYLDILQFQTQADHDQIFANAAERIYRV